MRYLSFSINNYRAIEGPLEVDLSKSSLIPLVGLNECGKTTILQAIYSFDALNDAEYEGKHLKDTKNLYHTKEKGQPIITAKIEIKWSELKEYFDDEISSYNKKIDEQIVSEKGSTNDEGKIKSLEEKKSETEWVNRSDFPGYVLISRNLELKQYSLPSYSSMDADLANSIANTIVLGMPYILYNDDFMDRPPNSIKIPKNQPSTLNGWLAIFERLFKSTSKDYSLFQLILEKDTRRRDAILSDVQEVLNTTLSKAWRNFSLATTNDIAIHIRLNGLNNDSIHSHVLEIQIVERINSKERFFDVIDRSKGFLWFFNFVMKLEFNPKVLTGSEKWTVYLLDEPGSYLHYSAQDKLCKKLVNISSKHGVVIYCTHSHTLLNPEIISLNNIYIVQKDKSKRISATPLNQVKTINESNNAFQPIHEALQISAFEYGAGNNSILAVEGIYDKYAIELILKLKNVSILPGTSANSIIKNIQFLNGYSKLYVAIWDNDEEGQKQYKNATKFFGEIEAQKFDLLPKGEKNKRRMEDMFLKHDLEMINKELQLDIASPYEKTIASLYFSKKEIKSKIVASFSEETLKNFKILEEIVNKRLAKAKEIASGEIHC